MKNRLGLSYSAFAGLLFSQMLPQTVLAQDPSESVIKLDTVIVSATREEKSQSEIDGSVNVLKSEEIDFVAPAHPSELLNRTAGVHINNLGGEGHMTSIRQPITTSGVYLFLEDGIPTRPTGMFNHNALYEINVPQAGQVEVIKGPGSALFGSDSIGGVINTITKESPSQFEASINPEVGSNGWKRLLTTVGGPVNENLNYSVNLNVTKNDGYREESAYNRNAGSLRLDGFIGDNASYKTLLSHSSVKQSGVSSLEEDDYLNDPTKNFYHNDVGRRELKATRLSTEVNYEPDSTNLYTVTPFYRKNEMNLMPSWMLTYDPNDREYKFESYGLLAKHRKKISNVNAEIITGIDIDYTPSTYKEIEISTTKDNDIYIDTSPTGVVNYDYAADQLSISPYVHTEWQAKDNVRLTAGLRYDYFEVDYTDNLPASVAEGRHLRPDSQKLSYDSVSPKLGVIYNTKKNREIYGNYRHSFRVPSIGQSFRSGSTSNTDTLDPVKTDSFEIGVRGESKHGVKYDATAYHMIVNDDIVSVITNNDRQIANAGKTEHQGFELSVQGDITDQLSASAAFSYTNQKYKDFSAIVGFPPTEINYAGNNVASAPKNSSNLSIKYKPEALKKSQFEVEWEHLGKYYTDPVNSQEYDGHDLLNLRASYEINKNTKIYARALNVADERYSTSTSNQVGSADIQYRPGLPRSYFVGVKTELK